MSNRSAIVVRLDHLSPELEASLRAGKTSEGWDQEAVKKVVRHEYDFLGPFVEARVEESGDGGDNPVLVVELSVDPDRDLANAEQTFEEATAKADRGDISGALGPLSKLVEEFPEIAKYHRAFGQAYFELGDPENAEDELLRALRLDPLDPDAHTVLGNVYAAKGRQDLAIRFYERSLELSRSVHALSSLGATLARTGRLDEAIDTFRDAVDEDPTYPQAWFGLGLSLSRKRDRSVLREAIQALDQALAAAGERYAAPEVWDSAQKQILGLVPIEAEEESELAKKINEEVADAEGTRQGIPVELVTSEDLPVLAKIEYAWVHQRSVHRVIMQSAEVPERDHHVRHELEHLRLANLARDAGRNRWFGSNDLTKDKALSRVQGDIERISKSLSPEAVSGFIDSVYHGLMAQLYNFPVDLLIEQRILKAHPELRELVFYSVWKQLQTGAKAAHDPELQDLTPPLIFRANAAMNACFALWFEEEFPRRTDIVDRFRSADGWGLAEDLYETWKSGAETWTPGEELDWVDSWAEQLGLNGWYYWVEDEEQNTYS